MIARITGKIIEKLPHYLVVDCSGVGYKVSISPKTASGVKGGGEVSLFTHLAIKENSHELYGFLKKEELDFFELLISVSGIGPKVGMAVLSQASPGQLRNSIALEDSSLLTGISGIGEKTAQRMILELKSKIGTKAISPGAEKATRSELEALEALVALGYSQVEARKALQNPESKAKTVEERVKNALKLLAK